MLVDANVNLPELWPTIVEQDAEFQKLNWKQLIGYVEKHHGLKVDELPCWQQVEELRA